MIQEVMEYFAVDILRIILINKYISEEGHHRKYSDQFI